MQKSIIFVTSLTPSKDGSHTVKVISYGGEAKSPDRYIETIDDRECPSYIIYQVPSIQVGVDYLMEVTREIKSIDDRLKELLSDQQGLREALFNSLKKSCLNNVVCNGVHLSYPPGDDKFAVDFHEIKIIE
jgi:hypothetical protein